MSHGYRVVQWTPFKKAFDIGLVLGVLAFLVAYVAAATLTQQAGQSFTPIQLLIRALGALAFSLLTLILCIGPLARLSRAFSPALYNRRHLGVTCFLVSLAHASLVLLWYHGFADLNPLVSLLVSNPRYDAIGGFPFESLGLIALLLLSVLAATSHDFWNANLGPVVWKAIHMSVYGAYVLVVAHVLLGAVQSARLDLYAWLVLSAAALVSGLHLIAALRERRRDAPADALCTALPLAWLLSVTMTAGWHKIWNPDRRVGFLAQADHLKEQLAAGAIPAEKLRETAVVIFNNQLDAVITGVFMLVVWIVLLDALRTWLRVLRGPSAAPAVAAGAA